MKTEIIFQINTTISKLQRMQNRIYVQIRRVHVFVGIAIVIIIFYILSNTNYRPVSAKEDLISFVNMNKGRIVDFVENLKIDGLPDSNFYIEHRFKENKYYFFRLNGEDLGEYFHLDASSNKAFQSAATSLNIKNVWKYPDENFYTLVLRGMEKLDGKKVFFLVLKKGDSIFSAPSNSSMSYHDTTSSLSTFESGKSIYIADPRIWVKLKN